MSSSPYIPPTADMKNAPPAPPASAAKAVLLGFAVDIGGSLALGIVMSSIYGFVLAGQGMNLEQIGAALTNMQHDSWFSIAAMILGAGISMLGGYVCARVSRRSDYKLGFILAAISVAVGLLFTASSYTLAMSALTAALTVCAILLGTKLGKARPTAG